MPTDIASLPAAPPAAPPDRRFVRITYEASILGLSAFAVPPVVLVSFAGIGFLAGMPGRVLTAALEAGVPLAAGIAAATLLAAEPALELQLATPGGFRRAAFRRLAILGVWAALLSLGAVAVGRVTGLLDPWLGGVSLADELLMPLAPLAAFTTWGCLAGVVLRSRGAASAALTSFWLAALAWKDMFLTEAPLRAWYPFQLTFAPHSQDVFVTRLTLLGLAGVALVVTALVLGRDEWLLGSEDR